MSKRPTPESRVVESVMRQLATIERCEFRRQNTGAVKIGKRFVRFGQPGQADIIACIKGRYVEIECKAGKGKLTEDQRTHGRMIISVGGIYIVIRDDEKLPEWLWKEPAEWPEVTNL